VSRLVVNETFYNEDAAHGASELVITEGVTDCISEMQAGVACISPVTVRFRTKDHGKLVSLTARAARVVVCNDSEESGAGEAGAIETGLALHAAGRHVRIAVIPRPEGVAKIDVNELVAKDGPEALKQVIAAARRLSRVARAITGTNWNGFLFFGLLRGTNPPAASSQRARRRPGWLGHRGLRTHVSH
jgi:DNA primase